MRSALAHPKYRPDIDGLRAVAVLSVVAFHAAPGWFSGGFVGVDIFFVISGYLISTIIFGNLAKGTFSFAEFYARRIKRIFPSLIVVMCAVGIIGWYVLFEDEFAQLGKHIAAGAGFVSNLVLWSESGYFDAAADTKPLLHLWSLGIEEQFYIAWPLVAWLAWRRQIGLSGITCLLVVGSFGLNIATISSDPVGTFYSPLSRVWELSIGSLLAWYRLENRSGILSETIARSASLVSVAGLLLVATAFALLSKHSLFPGWWALLPVLGTVLIIAAGPSAWLNRVVLSHRVMIWFGLISYPLYLWHWPLLSFVKVVDPPSFQLEARVAAVAAAILLAWLSYRYVEKPLRQGAENIAKVWALSGLMLLVLAFGLAIYSGLVAPRNNTPGLGQLVRAKADWEFPPSQFRAHESEGNRLVSINGMVPEVVVVLGDSTAQQYAPRVARLAIDAPSRLRSVVFATEGGCPPIPGVFRDDRPMCGDRLRQMFKVASEERVGAVVIAACWYCYFVYAAHPDSDDHYYMLVNGRRVYFKHGEAFDAAFDSLEKFLRELASQKPVSMVLSTPSGPRVSPSSMFSGERWRTAEKRLVGPLKKQEFLEEFGPIRAKLMEIARRVGVQVIDPIEYLCTEEVCPVITEAGDPIFKDSVHLRASFVRNEVFYLDGLFLK